MVVNRWLVRALAAIALAVIAIAQISVFPPAASSGSGLPSGCTGATGQISCDEGFVAGDGTKTSGLLFPELVANGTSAFGLFGQESQSANICYFAPTTDTNPGEYWADSGVTDTAHLPDGSTLTCAIWVPVSVGTLRVGVDAGSTDTYAANLPICPGAYEANSIYWLVANTINTGAASVNFCTLGAKSIKVWSSGSLGDPASGDIPAGAPIPLFYNGTYMVMTPMNKGAGGSSTWRAGGFFYSNDAAAGRVVSGGQSNANSDASGTCPLCTETALIAANGTTEAVLTIALDDTFTTSGAITVKLLYKAENAASEDLTARTICGSSGTSTTLSANSATTQASGANSTSNFNLVTFTGVVTTGCAANGFMHLAFGKASSANRIFAMSARANQ